MILVSIPLLCDCRSLLKRYLYRRIYVPCVNFYAEAKLVSSLLFASANMIETFIPDAEYFVCILLILFCSICSTYASI